MAVFTIVYTEESNIMPRTAAQNKAIKDKRKKRLLEVALKTFAYRGYTDVTIDDITKAVAPMVSSIIISPRKRMYSKRLSPSSYSDNQLPSSMPKP